MSIGQIIRHEDSLDFVKSLPGGWDTIIWDPPYMDPQDKKHLERVNTRSKLQIKKQNRGYPKQLKNSTARLMERPKRKEILDIIKSKMNPLGHILQFHTIKEELWKDDISCLHYWIRYPQKVMSGSRDPFNAEHINIIGPKIPGRKNQLDTFIVVNMKSIYNGYVIKRACAKPTELFEKLYKHLDSQFILDPFAGLGNSIKAARGLGLTIQANDIDKNVNWDFRKQLRLEI